MLCSRQPPYNGEALVILLGSGYGRKSRHHFGATSSIGEAAAYLFAEHGPCWPSYDLEATGDYLADFCSVVRVDDTLEHPKKVLRALGPGFFEHSAEPFHLWSR